MEKIPTSGTPWWSNRYKCFVKLYHSLVVGKCRKILSHLLSFYSQRISEFSCLVLLSFILCSISEIYLTLVYFRRCLLVLSTLSPSSVNHLTLEADSVFLLDAWSDLSLPFLWSLCSNISLDLIFWILELSPANPGFNTRLLSSSSSAGLVSLYLFLASLDSFSSEVSFILCYQSHSLRQKDIVSPIIISNFNIISNKSIGNFGYVHACFCWHCRHYQRQFSSVLKIVGVLPPILIQSWCHQYQCHSPLIMQYNYDAYIPLSLEFNIIVTVFIL